MRIDVGADADVATLVRGVAGDVTLVVAEGGEPLRLAMMLAAIAPLAIARAPGMRVNAVLVGTDAMAADIDSAAAFLESANSTTGQVLRVTAR